MTPQTVLIVIETVHKYTFDLRQTRLSELIRYIYFHIVYRYTYTSIYTCYATHLLYICTKCTYIHALINSPSCYLVHVLYTCSQRNATRQCNNKTQGSHFQWKPTPSGGIWTHDLCVLGRCSYQLSYQASLIYHIHVHVHVSIQMYKVTWWWVDKCIAS